MVQVMSEVVARPNGLATSLVLPSPGVSTAKEYRPLLQERLDSR